MCITLGRSGNMPISMLWSVFVSSRGIDGRGNDDREKDVVPHLLYLLEIARNYCILLDLLQ